MKKIALALTLVAAALVGNVSNAQAQGAYPGYYPAPGYVYRTAPVNPWGVVAAGAIVGAVIAGASVYTAPQVYAVQQPVYQQPVPNYACPVGTAAFYTNVASYDAYGRPYSSYQLVCR